MYAVLTNGWPVETRASGMGLGFMMGRIGGFTAILTSGRLLALSEHSVLPIFITALIALIFVIVAALVINRHVPAHAR
jgi:lipopolysaccharide export LptBFGC system permease protein LptF